MTVYNNVYNNNELAECYMYVHNYADSYLVCAAFMWLSFVDVALYILQVPLTYVNTSCMCTSITVLKHCIHMSETAVCMTYLFHTSKEIRATIRTTITRNNGIAIIATITGVERGPVRFGSCTGGDWLVGLPPAQSTKRK